jgi:hypothetical protein
MAREKRLTEIEMVRLSGRQKAYLQAEATRTQRTRAEVIRKLLDAAMDRGEVADVVDAVVQVLAARKGSAGASKICYERSPATHRHSLLKAGAGRGKSGNRRVPPLRTREKRAPAPALPSRSPRRKSSSTYSTRKAA